MPHISEIELNIISHDRWELNIRLPTHPLIFKFLTHSENVGKFSSCLKRYYSDNISGKELAEVSSETKI